MVVPSSSFVELQNCDKIATGKLQYSTVRRCQKSEVVDQVLLPLEVRGDRSHASLSFCALIEGERYIRHLLDPRFLAMKKMDPR